MTAEPRILLWDLETAPVLGYTWGAYEQDILWKVHDWYLLSIAWKFLGEKTTHVKGLDNYALYDTEPENDYELARLAWELMDQADIVVAHNGIAFDEKKARARMIQQGFEPPSSVIEVDTLKLARYNFAFTTNKLTDVCQDLGIGKKIDTGGIDLWRRIVEEQDPKAWALMKKYNRHDVELLEELYLMLRPWQKTGPNLATMSDRPDACPKCGSTEGFDSKGWTHTAVSKRQRFRCKSCRGSVSGRQIFKTGTQHVN